MIPALFTSASALEANQLLLSVVGNNLANSNTTGYKSHQVRFSDQFSQLLTGPSEPTSKTGGVNPKQLGFGVQVASTSTNLSQGTSSPTGNPLDLAIQGSGYFVLNNGGQQVYSRAGSFAVDANNNLVDPATGAKVQRTGTVGEATATTPGFQIPRQTEINIPNGLTFPGTATSIVSFKGNLNPSAVGPLAAVLTSAQALTVAGLPATGSTALNKLDQNSSGYGTGDQITVTGTRADGTSVSAVYTANGTSDKVQDLLDTINTVFLSGSTGTGATATIDATGHIALTANQIGPAKLTLTLADSVSDPTPTTGITQFSNFVKTTTGKFGDQSTTVIPVYDSQGTSHNVTFTFEKVNATQWNVSASLNPDEGTITGKGEDNTVAGLTFNSDGSFQSISGKNTIESLLTSSPFTATGAAATASTTLDSLDQHTGTPYALGDTITITGKDFAGNQITPVAFAANGANLGGLVAAINTAFKAPALNPLASIDASGNIKFTAPSYGQTPLTIKLTDTVGNTGGTTKFSDFLETTRGTTGNDDITFQINSLANIGKPQSVKLFFGDAGMFDGVSQSGGSNTVSAVKQDGYAQGTLTTTSVGKDGTITGQFSNGRLIPLAQIALATFSNAEGLEQIGKNYLAANTSTGQPTILAPQAGSSGSIQGGALESSNVDVGTEFTQLITAQRGYQVNAKAFSAANEMMQETANLIR